MERIVLTPEERAFLDFFRAHDLSAEEVVTLEAAIDRQRATIHALKANVGIDNLEHNMKTDYSLDFIRAAVIGDLTVNYVRSHMMSGSTDYLWHSFDGYLGFVEFCNNAADRFIDEYGESHEDLIEAIEEFVASLNDRRFEDRMMENPIRKQ